MLESAIRFRFGFRFGLRLYAILPYQKFLKQHRIWTIVHRILWRQQTNHPWPQKPDMERDLGVQNPFEKDRLHSQEHSELDWLRKPPHNPTN